ncbi:DNA cytosine methyltransferase [Pseudomonas sp. 3JA]|uniref:DNA cytosine methyltransferase n=1 Tax=Pseudomonas sp. 3JA TaxID=3109347 RepID=UPI003009B63E
MSGNSNIKIADLFCGMGGLTIGAAAAAQELKLKLEINFACDIDSEAVSFYKKNFESNLESFYDGDISDIVSDSFAAEQSTNEEQISKRHSDLDFLFAGPPCQGHSNLNNHSRRSDPRNYLYLKTIRFIQLSKPKFFLIENVPSVIHSSESIIDKSLALLESFGYQAKEIVIDFMRIGIPQSRKRHVIFGCLTGNIDKILSNIYTDEKKVLSDVLEDLLDTSESDLFNTASKMTNVNLARAEYLFSQNCYDLPNHLRPKCHQQAHSYKSMYGRMKWDEVAQTMTSGFGSMGQGRYLHPLRKRVITPHEAARIQGLPDWLDYSEVKSRSSLQKMIGNAVPPALSKRFVLSAIGEQNGLI